MSISAISPSSVPPVKSVNGKTGAVTLTASDVSAVPTTRKVNNKQLNADITLSASDVSAVPTSRTVNGKPLSSNVTLSANDVGALPTSGGTLTGNLTGKYLTGTWLQATDLGNRASNTIKDTGYFATIDGSGWVYQVPSDTVATAVGSPAHQNQLINGFFLVWQINKGSYSGSAPTGQMPHCMLVDGWQMQATSNKATSLERVWPCGIKNTSSETNVKLRQNMVNATQYNGHTMTYSVLKQDSSGQKIFSSVTKVVSGVTEDTNMVHYFLGNNLYNYVGPSEIVYAHKLEYGDKQTLAHQDSSGTWVLNDIPSYTTELNRCKRFLVAMDGGIHYYRNTKVTDTTIEFIVPVGIPLRVDPVNWHTPHIYKSVSSPAEVTGATFTYKTSLDGNVLITATFTAAHGTTNAILMLPDNFCFNALQPQIPDLQNQ